DRDRRDRQHDARLHRPARRRRPPAHRVAAHAPQAPHAERPGHQLRDVRVDLHAHVGAAARVPRAGTPVHHAAARRRRAAHQLRLRGRPLVLAVLADLGPASAVAGAAARHERPAVDHQRLRRARRHPLLAQDPALHGVVPRARARHPRDLHLRPRPRGL
ncbi:MAG: Succinate dehydrogenase hydrophobic membrane anchor protein, partial [uncultured Frankineae bacterium]